MSARDAVDHHSSQLKLRLRCKTSDRKLSREVAVRNNVKHVASSSRSNSSRAVSRSRLSVGPVRLRRKDPRDRRNRSSHGASVSQRQRVPNRRRSNQNTSVRRKRRNSSSLSRSAVILERAKARNHKTRNGDYTD